MSSLKFGATFSLTAPRNCANNEVRVHFVAFPEPSRTMRHRRSNSSRS